MSVDTIATITGIVVLLGAAYTLVDNTPVKERRWVCVVFIVTCVGATLLSQANTDPELDDFEHMCHGTINVMVLEENDRQESIQDLQSRLDEANCDVTVQPEFLDPSQDY